MSTDTHQYARLANDSYEDRSKEMRDDRRVDIGGVTYKILAVENNRVTGYQGTAYQRVDTGEVVIAHRGTEGPKTDRQDAWTDLRMVTGRINQQLDGAVAFTDRATALATKDAERRGLPLHVSITGHSLGGTLAEITAARTGLHAETFNAYGAGNLTDLKRYGVDVHAPHPHITNHRVATDVVSAASPHLGPVKAYATEANIQALEQGRYLGGNPLPANPLMALQMSAHSQKANFVDNTIVTPANEARAQKYVEPIAHFARDVARGRGDFHAVANSTVPGSYNAAADVGALRLGGQVIDAVGTSAARGVGRLAMARAQADIAIAQAGVQGAQVAGQKAAQLAGHATDWAGDRIKGGLQAVGRGIDEGVASVKQRLGLGDPQHPANGVYQQAQAGMQKIDAGMGRKPDQFTDQAAACLTVAGCRAGMTRIDGVEMGADGKNVWIHQGKPGHALSTVTGVPVAQFGTSMAQSSQDWGQLHQQQQQDVQAQQHRQSAQQQHAVPQHAQAMGR